jgi:hypothetical protein
VIGNNPVSAALANKVTLAGAENLKAVSFDAIRTPDQSHSEKPQWMIGKSLSTKAYANYGTRWVKHGARVLARKGSFFGRGAPLHGFGSMGIRKAISLLVALGGCDANYF